MWLIAPPLGSHGRGSWESDMRSQDRSAYVAVEGISAHEAKLEITPPKNQRLDIKQNAEQNFGGSIGGYRWFESIPNGRSRSHNHSFLASVQEMETLENLPVLQISQGIESERQWPGRESREADESAP